MSRAEMKVTELVDKIEREELQLPAMQRQYVWKATKVRDLLDSLYRGYPSGAILMWESFDDIATRDFAVSSKSGAVARPLLLLDGQQRLTSLSAVIRGEPIQNGKRKRTVDILFNLDHPDELVPASAISSEEEDLDEEADEDELEEDNVQTRLKQRTFTVSSRALASLPNWVSVSEIFKNEDVTPILQRAGVEDFKDPRYKKYVARLQNLKAIKDYVYRVDVLEATMSYDEVTEIFVRVNSLGMQLKSSDLALAQITAKWRGSLKILQDFEKKSAESGLKLDLGSHVRGLVVMATGQSRFRTVSSIGLEDLKVAWAASEKGTNFAVNFLKANCSIPSLALMSSPFLVQALAYFGHVHNFELTKDESTQLRKWALLANAKGRYSRGSSETLLDQDLSTIKNGGTAVDLLNRLAGQVGRLDVIEEDLAGRNQRSSLFKTLFMAMAEDGAEDWKTGIKLKIDHSGAQDRIQFHHIFPKDLLKAKYSTAEIDDIANLAFISGKTNRQILNDFPAKYIPKLAQDFGAERFDHHLLPTLVPEELDIDAYPEFLRARRVLLASRLNSFLGTAAQ
jgi:hypothetical protein